LIAVERRRLWAAMMQFVSLEKENVRIRSSERILKLVDGEPTPVMPNEIEKLIRELPRDPEIVTLFKRISDECMIARPCNLMNLFVSGAFIAVLPPYGEEKGV